MPSKRIKCLGMALPISDHALIIDEESNTVVGGRVELVVVRSLRNEVPAPTHRKMIEWAFRRVAVVAPLEHHESVSTNQCRRAVEILVVKIFALQTRLAA